MIQRIQTVFLLAIVVLLGILLLLPYAQIIKDPIQSVFSISVHKITVPEGYDTIRFSLIPQAVLTILCISITLITIFLFKKRMLQVRLCVANTILLVGLQGLLFYYARASANFVDGVISYNLIFIFPIISAILAFLSLRAIARDEALVRSLDRLR